MEVEMDAESESVAESESEAESEAESSTWVRVSQSTSSKEMFSSEVGCVISETSTLGMG